MNYSYKIITEDSKLVIEEFLTGQIIAKHSLNKIIRIKKFEPLRWYDLKK